MKKMAVVVLLLALETATLVHPSNGATSKCPQFQCQNGKCISWTAYCDKHVDCSDDTDESTCDCTRDSSHKKFQCVNKECISLHDQCDGKKQCRDGTDEIYCKWSEKSTSGSHTSISPGTNTTTTPPSTSSSSSPRPSPHHQHVLMWVIMGTVGGITALLSCLSLLAVYIAVATVSVKRYREGRDHPMMLHYDSVPGDEEDNEDGEVEGNVYETTQLLEQPPSYQELEKAEKSDLPNSYKRDKGPH